MDKSEIPNLIYLSLFAVVLVGSLITSNFASIGKLARFALVWVVIIGGATVLANQWPQIEAELQTRSSTVTGSGEVSIPQNFDGHYYITLDLNGNPVRFVIDTGATEMVLTPQDAAQAGIDMAALNYNSRAMTANGMVQTASIRLDEVSVAGITDRNVSAVVNGAPMQESLLGMSYLSRFDRISIENGRMVLAR